MQTKSLRRLAAIALAMVGNVALAQSGWVEMASTGSGGLKNLPLNGTYDANIAQASWAHQGGRGPFLSWVSTYSGNPQWNIVVPMDDGSLWRSTDGGQTLTNVFPAASAPAGARPQHAVRLPNGALYVAFAPTSNDLGLYCDTNFNFTQPIATMAFDPRYKVLRSGNDGVTWEDTGLSTVNGVSAAGSQVEVNWGGWEDSANSWGLVDLGVYTWTDTGIGNPWSSITVEAQQTQVGIQHATMMWTESFRSGGTATDNFMGSTLTGTSIYETACGGAGTCGGMDNTQDDLFIFLGPSGGWTRNYDWQGFNHCSGGDTATEPSRGGSVTAWDNPSQGISLNFQAKGGVNAPSGMGLFNAAGTNVGPGGNSISGYQHSVSSMNNVFATTWNNQVYISGDGGADWAQITNSLPGPVDPTGNFSFVGGRILLANLNSAKYSDTRLIALTQDTLGATPKGTTRVWVYTDAPSAPVVQISDNGAQSSGFAACTGDTITFTVATAASDLENDPIEYQWQSSADGYTWNNMGTPATALTYVLSSISSSTPTSWRVVASSSLDGVSLASTPSSTMTFTINPAPGFSSVPGPFVGCPGLDQTLTYAIAGPPNATYTLSIFMNGTSLSIPSLHNAQGATPNTVATDISGFGNFTVFIPGSLLTNDRRDGFTQTYAFSTMVSSN